MAEPVRPVLLEEPQAQQKWVNPNGTASTYGLRFHHAVFMRLGGYEDSVWRALGVGFTGLAQISSVSQRVDSVETAIAAAQGAIAGLRGDPRLDDAVAALKIAVTALAQAMARSSGETERRLLETDGLVASMGGRLTKASQIASVQEETARRDAVTAAMFQVAVLQRQGTEALQVERVVNDAISGLTTTDIPEGSNEYYTPAKADARIAAAVGVSVQAYDSDLTAFAGKTAPAGAVVGTTDSQTLTNKTLTAPAISGPSGLVKADVGLSNVDNTADSAKPVSTAQLTALNLKANAAAPTLTGRLTVTLDSPSVSVNTTGHNFIGGDVGLGIATDGTANAASIQSYEPGVSWTSRPLLLQPNGGVIILQMSTYANNAAAVSGGLAVNTLYKTATGEVRTVV